MRIVTARLKTRTMPNGHEVIRMSVPLGKEYRIDLDSQRTRTLFNPAESRLYDLQVVRVVGAPKGAEWFPRALLEVADEEGSNHGERSENESKS